MVRIVIIDSGIYPDHSVFKGKRIEMLEYHQGIFEPGGYDNYGHGTAIAGIIAKNEDICITSIKIQGIEDNADENDLITVLEYVKNELSADIINVSLGVNTLEKKGVLYRVCEEIASTGTVIVAAFDNSGAFSYPAVFDNVIGVISSSLCKKIDDIVYIDDTEVNIAAKGESQRVAWINPTYMICSGNSLACAHVSSLIVKYIKMGVRGKNAILEKLRNESKYKFSFNRNVVKEHGLPYQIKKAAIFPFSKETHSLIRFEPYLDFEIVDVYDTKYSTLVGASTNHLLNISNFNNHTIKNIDDMDWESFDTIIVGHLDYVADILGDSKYAKHLIENFRKHEKNIFSFDDLRKSGFDRATDIYFPVVDKCMAPLNRFGMLYEIPKPILGVFGTSSKQGKYTLQLELRLGLQKMGYKVGQIGTEPQSLLFGFDSVFPMGYNSSVYLNGEDTIFYLNDVINTLCESSDIIIVGSQSGTVPYDTTNIEQFPLSQISFLYATQPDAVIVCINPYDSFEYIKRTIQFIESGADCKVIALVIFPMTFKEGWTFGYGPKYHLTSSECMNIKIKTKDAFGIPVYCLGDSEEMNKLLKQIVEFF